MVLWLILLLLKGSIGLVFDLTMRKFLRPLLCLAVTGSIFTATPASAQSKWSDREREIYDYGFNYGSLSAACYLFANGEISKDVFLNYAELAKSEVKPDYYKRIVEIYSNADSGLDFMTKCAPYVK